MDLDGILSEIFHLLGSWSESAINNVSANYDRRNRKFQQAKNSSAYETDPTFRAKVDAEGKELEEFYDTYLTDEKMDQYDQVIRKMKGS